MLTSIDLSELDSPVYRAMHIGAEPDASEHIVRIEGAEAVRIRTGNLAEETVVECVSLVWGTSEGYAGKLEFQRMLLRDVKMRRVMQYAGPETAQMHTRIATGIPISMIVYDRKVALLPIDPRVPLNGALELRSRGIVAAAYALFEQVWAAATPAGAHPASVPSDGEGLSPQMRALIEILAAGGTDEAAARRLGVSVRTVKRMAADLRERLNARSRFEVGVRAAHRGWI